MLCTMNEMFTNQHSILVMSELLFMISEKAMSRMINFWQTIYGYIIHFQREQNKFNSCLSTFSQYKCA